MGQENHQIERLQLSKVGIGVLEPKPSKTQILMKGIIWQNNWECRKPPEVTNKRKWKNNLEKKKRKENFKEETMLDTREQLYTDSFQNNLLPHPLHLG